MTLKEKHKQAVQKAEQLWTEFKHLEKESAPAIDRMDVARKAWYEAHQKAQAYEFLLKEETKPTEVA